jgi:nicotinate-nucleotide pyrophosphorylase (carboxylating)
MSDLQDNQPDPKYVATNVAAALVEDVGTGDLTAALVPASQTATASVIARENCIVCGQAWFDEVFRQLDPGISIEWNTAEGRAATANDVICTVRGPAPAVLTGERTALNFLQLLSATATIANQYVTAVADTKSTILDTRKTIPGLRLAQKYAVRCGGATNHRIGLYDAILIKENHIAAAGGIADAVAAASDADGDVMIEVEVETLDQTRQALTSGAHRLLLDNFSIEDLATAVTLRDENAPDITLEASGGITLENVGSIAATRVDFISIGALTKDIAAIDLSMRFELSQS